MLHRKALLSLALVAVTAVVAAAETHTVELAGFDFTPSDLTIQVGDTVEWVWISGLHNVESGVNGVFDGNFTSGDPVQGGTFSVTFDEAFLAANPMPDDEYPYYCIVHLNFGMTGIIRVQMGGDCGGNYALTHTRSDLIAGQPATFEATGAMPGETVFFLRSLAGAGCGACPPQIGGQCLDILSPFAVLGQAVADATGRAVLMVPIPASVPLVDVATQAVAIRGAGGADSVKSLPVSGMIMAP